MRILSVFLLSACHVPNSIHTSCEPTGTGPDLALDEISPLGFSGSEVMDLLYASTHHTVEAKSIHDEPQTERILDFVFEPAREVHVADRGSNSHFCVEGPVLIIPGTLSVSEAAGWFTATGPMEIRAKSADLSEIWVDGTLAVEPSDELWQTALENNHHTCTEEDLSVQFVQTERVETPWATGPVGGIETETCFGGPALYRWGGPDE